MTMLPAMLIAIQVAGEGAGQVPALPVTGPQPGTAGRMPDAPMAPAAALQPRPALPAPPTPPAARPPLAPLLSVPPSSPVAQVPAAPKPAAPAPVAASASRSQVEAAVRSEWARYDSAGTGRLNPLQFSTWVLKANGATVKPAGAAVKDPGVKPVRAMNATARAFATADADHDGGVTPAEMTSFLMRQPVPAAK